VPWESTDRLHEKGLILYPKSKAKSVVLTEEGRRAAEEAFRRLFAP
jgi:Mn-dependent DtxR family transcriptional regulator